MLVLHDMTDIAVDRSVFQFVAVDTCLHGEWLFLPQDLSGRDWAVTRRAVYARGCMLLMAEEHKLR